MERNDVSEGISWPRRARWLPSAVTMVIAVGVLSGLSWWLETNVTPDADRMLMARRWHETRSAITLTEFRQPGQVRIVAYTDYQCEFCAERLPMFARVVSDYRDSGRPVELLAKDFPLDSKCNPGAGVTIHPVACESAVAVRLATIQLGARQGQALADSLYVAGSNTTVEQLQDMLQRLGLRENFTKRYEEILRLVQADAQQGRDLAVWLTPTVFVNGRIANPRDEATLRSLIEYELALLRN